MPSRSVADQLLDTYFDTYDGVFRIFHASNFRTEYENYWREPSAARDVFILLLQACMALGTMASTGPLQFGHAPIQWLTEASSWIVRSFVWPQKLQPTFEELQLSCLLCLADTNGPKTERLCWVSAGDLVRKAMALNLHRDPAHLGIHKPQDAEMRRRLWATIMELNLLVSLQAAQPPLISPMDWDTRTPEAAFDEELDTAGEMGRPVVSSVQPLLSESLSLRALIVSSLSTADGPLPYSEILRLHRELTQAHKRLKKSLISQGGETGDTQSHAALADIIFFRFFLALHLPVLGRSPRDPAVYFSRRACVDSAIKMLGSCGIVDSGRQQGSLGVKQLFLNNSGLFRGLAMQPLYAILLELTSAAEDHRDSMGTLPAWDETQVRHYAELSQTWVENRLKAGSRKVHSCCFVAACRAYAAALTAGPETSVDQAMVDAALETSQRCQDILASALHSLESANSRHATPIAETMGTEAVASDTGSLYEYWQDTFTTTGADDFFGFDWTLLMEPGMSPTQESGAHLPMP